MTRRGAAGGRRRYERAPHLISYWSGRHLVIENFAARRRSAATPALLAVLDLCAAPVTAAILARQLRLPLARLRPLLDELVSMQLLRASDSPKPAEDIALERWTGWNPAAGFFHAATRDVPFENPEAGLEYFRRKIRQASRPPAVKRTAGDLLELPRPRTSGAFPRTLLQRRTWRRFGTRPITLAQLSSLLNLTAGIQGWSEGEADGRVAFKANPSGGARHPIETYVLALDVKGLQSGIYHYAADRHGLVRIGDAGRSDVSAFVPQQDWYSAASALFFFTAVVERTVWRYPYARAYQALLIEAGHVCQNFCLASTWLRLAPFCTLALGDTAVERALGLDGFNEIVLYAGGVGTKPAGEVWAPWPDEHGRRLTPNRRW